MIGDWMIFLGATLLLVAFFIVMWMRHRRKKEPTTYQKALALHISSAGPHSALD
jgi:hypothetical protein